ncbi:unnamed protein product, partial [Linum tenue]
KINNLSLPLRPSFLETLVTKQCGEITLFSLYFTMLVIVHFCHNNWNVRLTRSKLS